MSFLKENLNIPKIDFRKNNKRIKYLAGSMLGLTAIGVLIASVMFKSGVAGVPDRMFRAFTKELFCREASSNTISLHYTLKDPENYGIEKAEATFGKVSTNPTEIYATLENVKSSLEHFQKEDLSLKNQLTYDVLKCYLDNAERGVEYLLYDEPFGIVSGVQTQLPIVLSEYQFYDREDVDTYLELMETVPEYFEALLQFEEKKAEAGLFMSERAAAQVIAQCEAFVEMKENNYLISTFVDRINALADLDMQEKSDYMQKNASVLENFVLPAYDEVMEMFEKMSDLGVNAGGLCHFDKGKEYYEQLVQNLVGTTRTIEEIRELTQKQIVEDLNEMEALLSDSEVTSEIDTVEIMSQAVYAQEAAAMDEANPVTILNMLEEKIENTFPKAPETAVSVKYVAKEMEEHLSPAFYMIPAIDDYSQNVIYVNQAHMGDVLTLFTTLAHEGYPGHLYQTVYFAQTDPDPIRNIYDFGGYVEGWATYAEMCSYYLAPVEKSQAKLLQKYNSVILGVYTLADIGIHYDGWMLEDVQSFFSIYGISDEETVGRIYDLMIGSPGNYLKYYVGYVEFLELKKQWIAEKGNGFLQKEFHEAVLEVGPAPFEIVEEYMWKL